MIYLTIIKIKQTQYGALSSIVMKSVCFLVIQRGMVCHSCFVSVRDEILDQSFIYDAGTQTFIPDAGAPQNIRLAALITEFEHLKEQLVKGCQRARKNEQKLNTLTKGYMKKAETLIKSLGKQLFLDDSIFGFTLIRVCC